MVMGDVDFGLYKTLDSRFRGKDDSRIRGNDEVLSIVMA
jgi:hypothetical protein